MSAWRCCEYRLIRLTGSGHILRNIFPRNFTIISLPHPAKKIIRLCLPLFDGVCYFSEMRSSCLIDLVRLRSGCTLVKKNQDTISEKWWNKNDESIERVCLVFVLWVKVDGFHSSSEWTQRWRMCADQESITGTQFDWAELRKRRGLERNRKLGLSL